MQIVPSAATGTITALLTVAPAAVQFTLATRFRVAHGYAVRNPPDDVPVAARLSDTAATPATGTTPGRSATFTCNGAAGVTRADGTARSAPGDWPGRVSNSRAGDTAA